MKRTIQTIERALTCPTILEAARGRALDGSKVYIYMSDGRPCAGALSVKVV